MVREEQLIRDKDEELLYYKPSFFYSEQHLAKLLLQKLETRLGRLRDRSDEKSVFEAILFMMLRSLKARSRAFFIINLPSRVEKRKEEKM